LKLKGVVFDFDGVIADTEGLQKEKWDIILKLFGISISDEEYIREYCGKSSATEIPQLLKKKYGNEIPYTWEELARRASEVLKDLFRTKEIKLLSGAKEALEFFKQKGFKMAVCSAKDPEELEMKLRGAKLLEWFPPEYRSTQSEAGGKPKPFPDMYKLACQRLKLFPSECIAFEDTSAGVESAVKAGLYVVAMPNKWSKTHDFSMAHRIVWGGWPEFLTDPRL
jgi:beta-phosphoglucomutase